MKSISNFLVLLKLGSFDTARLQELVPNLETQLSRISPNDRLLAIRSINADLFGYLIRTEKHPQQIRAELESPGSWLKGGKPFLTGKDDLLIISLGGEFTASDGFMRALTWLQRNQSA